jgi:hypothetical protein
MPAALHVLAHYLLGAWTAWHARRSPSLQQQLLGWPLALAGVMMALLLVPCTTYQFRFYPDYAWGYALTPELYPEWAAATGPLSLAALVANVLALLLGYVIMRAGVIRAQASLQCVPVMACAGLLIGAWVMGGVRLWQYGTDAAFWAKEAAPFTQTPSAWCTLMAYGISLFSLRRLIHRFIHRPWHVV